MKSVNKMRKEIEDIFDKLPPSEETLLMNMFKYMSMHSSNTVALRQLQLDLAEYALELYEQGQLLSDVVGDGHQVYCDKLLTGIPSESTTDKIYSSLFIISVILFIATVVGTLYALIFGNEDSLIYISGLVMHIKTRVLIISVVASITAGISVTINNNKILNSTLKLFLFQLLLFLVIGSITILFTQNIESFLAVKYPVMLVGFAACAAIVFYLKSKSQNTSKK